MMQPAQLTVVSDQQPNSKAQTASDPVDQEDPLDSFAAVLSGTMALLPPEDAAAPQANRAAAPGQQPPAPDGKTTQEAAMPQSPLPAGAGASAQQASKAAEQPSARLLNESAALPDSEPSTSTTASAQQAPKTSEQPPARFLSESAPLPDSESSTSTIASAATASEEGPAADPTRSSTGALRQHTLRRPLGSIDEPPVLQPLPAEESDPAQTQEAETSRPISPDEKTKRSEAATARARPAPGLSLLDVRERIEARETKTNRSAVSTGSQTSPASSGEAGSSSTGGEDTHQQNGSSAHPSATQQAPARAPDNAASRPRPFEVTLPSGEEAASDTSDAADESTPDEPSQSGIAASGTSSSNSSGTARPAGRAPFMSQSFAPAWLQNVMNRSLRTASLENGWKLLEMQLDEGDGTVTIKARRGDDSVAVSVGFSDPALRALAASNADQLQEALQAQYDSSVDLSLMEDGTTGESAGEADAQEASSGTSPLASETSEENDLSGVSLSRARAAGARHEWIG